MSKPMNKFQSWYNNKTKNMTPGQRSAYRLILSQKLSKSTAALSRWIRGEAEPTTLEKKAVNVILKEKIYEL